MKIEQKLQQILDKSWSNIRLNREECKYLLSIDETSYASGLIRSTANSIIRSKNDNSAIILGQIGVEISPCPGKCKFCTFGDGHTKFEPSRIGQEELQEKMISFCKEGDLYALYLMTMHEYDLENFLNTIHFAKKIAPPTTQLWSNIGDTDLDTFKEIKKAGITGVYHVCRLGEGIDTSLKPENRIKTMQNALDAGLELYTCCEPIGPEHTIDQLVDNIFIGAEMGIYQHAAMRRVPVPGTPFAKYGQISELRLAHIVAVIALCTVTLPTMAYMGVHEPNQLSYASGANIITAESGANPRDCQSDTSKNRGMDMARCRKMLFECGFTNIRRGDESKIPLDFEYLVKTNSLD
ncbi:radical SAM protein [Clostridium drakei]|uniref:Radical SAM protein n=1 Tax=Clostridium drakei TaxID=332101 RepID=A0A2U8DV23_9CLOT|nr:radical SAM protein [Clostridium drakei]AWI05922.1 radical SAM protein [Clostridium drakei]